VTSIPVPGRCHIDPDSGKLTGPASITYNSPWPTKDCTPGGFGTAFGGVIHTEVGFEHTVIHEFNDPAAQASAFFSIGIDGHIHQYMPLGKNYKAWTQVACNSNWRGVEHEDQGHPEHPFTPAQLAASAQVFEAMSAFDGWPLEPTDNPNGGRGIIFHVDGGQAWGGHDCPGPVRQKQRPALIALARAIREGKPKPSPAPAAVEHVTQGALSLVALASKNGCQPLDIALATLKHSPRHQLPANVQALLNGLLRGTVGPFDAMPAGLHLFVPAKR